MEIAHGGSRGHARVNLVLPRGPRDLTQVLLKADAFTETIAAVMGGSLVTFLEANLSEATAAAE
ncbi:MAG: hypothetical protein P8R54_33675 [Myxococcota bacterium]|nr:hypothetical protein [Myxococcota bacterium]